MGKKYSLIDGNSVGRAAHSATKLRSGDLETQAVYGMLHSIRDFKRAEPDRTPLVLWDGRAQWRFDLHPLYKSNRENDPKKKADAESYKKQRPYIERALEALGVRQVTAFSHEADDMAGYFVSTLAADPTNDIELKTGDEDWIQLVRKNVKWCDHRDDTKRVTLANIMDQTGYPTPYAFLEGKALQGDTSDVISGVGGIGEGGAPEFIAQFGSVREFWRRCDAGEFVPTLKAHRSLYAGRCPHTRDEWIAQCAPCDPTLTEKEQAKHLKKHTDAWPGQGRLLFPRNLRLMQLLKVEKPRKEDMRVVTGQYDEAKFTAVCEELAFRSILKNVGLWSTVFQPR